MNKPLAEESEKTRKSREKLRRQMEGIDSEITQEALREKSGEIAGWIERHSSGRIPLKNKSISLFDENQNSEPMSAKVEELAEKLHKELSS